MKSVRRPLDPVVKIGLSILFGSLFLIGIGMFLSRPDRTIPPYSIGSYEGTVVAIHLPPWTSDPNIQSLIERFREVRKSTWDFGPLKIQPTTPDDPQGRYQRMTVYFFSDPTWTERALLHRYLTAPTDTPEERTFKKEFSSQARGGYHIDPQEEKGWIGPLVTHDGEASKNIQWLFHEQLEKSEFKEGARTMRMDRGGKGEAP